METNTKKAFIALKDESEQGILAGFSYNPQVASAMGKIAQTLLRGDALLGLTDGEKELVAAFASRMNECTFCTKSHEAVARLLLKDNALVDEVMSSLRKDDVTDPRWREICTLISEVTIPETSDMEEFNLSERKLLTDDEYYAIVTITSAFNMFNRFVIGLGLDKEDIPAEYYEMTAKHLVENGYKA